MIDSIGSIGSIGSVDLNGRRSPFALKAERVDGRGSGSGRAFEASLQ